jgi:transposase
MLLSPDMRDWLPRDHFVHFVVGLVESFDFADFVKEYRQDGRGGAAFHPKMMATLLFYAYCDGERSSRQIEERCQTDLVYRYITGNNAIDHVTICRFRDRFADQLAVLFVPVLAVCLKAGIGNLSLAAIDGTKLRCPASLRANRTLDRIEKEIAELTAEIEDELTRIVGEILAESHRADLADDPLPGMPHNPPRPPGALPDVRGLPKSLHGKATRLVRLTTAKQVLDDDWNTQLAAHDHRLRDRAAQIQRTGKGIRGARPKPPARDPKARVNTTDPDSRIMKNVHGGFIQGYNAQATAALDQTVVAAEVVNAENDQGELRPMMEETETTLAAAGSDPFDGVITADTGYRSAAVCDALDPNGPTVLMPTKKERETRKAARRPPARPDGPPPDDLSRAEQIDWMLDTAWGKETYKKRSATIEPVFGQNKHNRGVTSFQRCGLSAARSEWKLITMGHNARKLFRRVTSGNASVPFFAAGWPLPATS